MSFPLSKEPCIRWRLHHTRKRIPCLIRTESSVVQYRTAVKVPPNSKLAVFFLSKLIPLLIWLFPKCCSSSEVHTHSVRDSTENYCAMWSSMSNPSVHPALHNILYGTVPSIQQYAPQNTFKRPVQKDRQAVSLTSNPVCLRSHHLARIL